MISGHSIGSALASQAAGVQPQQQVAVQPNVQAQPEVEQQDPVDIFQRFHAALGLHEVPLELEIPPDNNAQLHDAAAQEAAGEPEAGPEIPAPVQAEEHLQVEGQPEGNVAQPVPDDNQNEQREDQVDHQLN